MIIIIITINHHDYDIRSMLYRDWLGDYDDGHYHYHDHYQSENIKELLTE